MAVFEVALDSQDVNVTQMKFSQVIRHARQVRQLSRCVTVMLVSSDQEFLAAFAEWSLKGRLLVWSTRLLIITQQPLQELRTLMSTHWTFSMLNVILINLDMGQELRCGVYTHLPYSPKGARLVRLATWTNTQGLVSITRIPIFPNKFSNFYGSSVNVTALTYAPHWMTSGSGSNTQYAGMDYLLLKTIADALNFTIHVLPSASWKEVTDQVEARRSFVASIVYVVLPSRMEKYDFTQIFDFTPFCFATSKPELKPQWQSLYKPFTKDVWGANLVAIILVTVAFHMK
ncbi:uncharacterized protein LOC121861248 [Homarus americanus]|uniref:uncharacterized protein LOC121861248 n=1 Tax=Homarus americanus TaxID=6706 RepID=UPI001C46F607|nr:uncharacterized protein LOC121861248 [Homarus americanus]